MELYCLLWSSLLGRAAPSRLRTALAGARAPPVAAGAPLPRGPSLTREGVPATTQGHPTDPVAVPLEIPHGDHFARLAQGRVHAVQRCSLRSDLQAKQWVLPILARRRPERPQNTVSKTKNRVSKRQQKAQMTIFVKKVTLSSVLRGASPLHARTLRTSTSLHTAGRGLSDPSHPTSRYPHRHRPADQTARSLLCWPMSSDPVRWPPASPSQTRPRSVPDAVGLSELLPLFTWGGAIPLPHASEIRHGPGQLRSTKAHAVGRQGLPL